MTTPDRPDVPTVVAEPAADATADEIVADIEATRADLGDTVDALARRLDVKAQAQAQARDLQARGLDLFAQVKDAATDEDGNLSAQARSIAVTGSAVLAAVLLLRTIVRHRRRR